MLKRESLQVKKTLKVFKAILQATLTAWLVCLLACGCVPSPSPAPTPTPIKSREDSLPASAVKVLPAQDAFPPILHASGWQVPAPVGGAINTAGAEDSPFVSPDGSQLYFFFTPDVAVPPERQLLDGVTGIYVSQAQDGTRGPAQRLWLQDPGKLALDGCAFVQGTVLWFCSAREGYTGINFFTADLKDGRWQNWRSTSDQLKQYQVGEMHISADGNELYFHSSREGGKGQLDLWVSKKVSGGWGTPENLEAVNSPENEGWPFVSQDGSQLWFTRTYQGTPAIFRSKRVNQQWGKPELIVSQFAGEPSLDNAGNLYFVHHFYQDGKMIEADIYMAAAKK